MSRYFFYLALLSKALERQLSEPTTPNTTLTRARKLERHVSKATSPDLVKLAEEASAAPQDEEVTRSLLVKRALTILGVLGILLVGILCRLFIEIPVDPPRVECIPLGNGTTSIPLVNMTLPYCNTTDFLNISAADFSFVA